MLLSVPSWFCLHNSLTFKAIDQLLKLLQILCVVPNKLPRSSFTLKKFFSHFSTINYEHYKLCSSCKEKIDNCQCNRPSSGDLLEIAIDKPLKVIVSRKLLLNTKVQLIYLWMFNTVECVHVCECCVVYVHACVCVYPYV